MKKLFGLILLLAPSLGFCADVVFFDTTTLRINGYVQSTSSLPYVGRNDAAIFPDGSGAQDALILSTRFTLATKPHKYLIVTGGFVVEMSTTAKAAVDQANIALTSTTVRAGAKALLNGFFSDPILQRAFADVVKDEGNIWRSWLTSFKAEVSSSTNLANFQSRVATLPNTPQRTLSQLKTAIEGKIDNGDVDQ